MKEMRVFLSFLIFFSWLTPPVQAKDLCTVYRNATPLPSWYNQFCGSGGGGFDGLKSVVGGAYSTFADAFSLNPASLPTVELPLGAELIASAPTVTGIGSPRLTMNAIKGFKGVGAGIGTDTNNSIFSNRANYRTFSFTTYTPTPVLPSISFASAVSLNTIFSPSTYRAWIPKLGAVFRYNQDLQNWSPGMGMAANLGPFSLGLSAIFEQPVSYYPKTTVITQNIGIHIFYFQLDYTLINNIRDYATSSASLFALSGNVGGFTLNVASRVDKNDITGSRIATYHAGLQYVFFSRLALAYLYNYIPGFQSLSAQVMF